MINTAADGSHNLDSPMIPPGSSSTGHYCAAMPLRYMHLETSGHWDLAKKQHRPLLSHELQILVKETSTFLFAQAECAACVQREEMNRFVHFQFPVLELETIILWLPNCIMQIYHCHDSSQSFSGFWSTSIDLFLWAGFDIPTPWFSSLLTC